MHQLLDERDKIHAFSNPKQESKSGFINTIVGIATFIFVLLGYTYKDARLVLYLFEILYIALMFYWSFLNRQRIGRYALWSGLFFGISLFSYFYAFDQQLAAKQVFNVLKGLLLGNSIIFYINYDSQRMDRLLKFIILSAVYTSLYLVITNPISSWGGRRLGWDIGLNPNELALKMALSSLICLYYGRSEMQRSYYGFALIFAIITLFTGSRKGLLMIILGTVLLFSLTVKHPRRLIIAGPLLVVFAAVSWNLILNSSFLYSVLGKRVEELLNVFFKSGAVDFSATTRLRMISTGIELFKDRPLLGHGIHNYRALTVFGTYAHNNYIELAVGLGLIGVIVYYSLYIGVLFRLATKIHELKYAGLFITILITMMVMEFGLVSYYSEIYIIILAAASASTRLGKKS